VEIVTSDMLPPPQAPQGGGTPQPMPSLTADEWNTVYNSLTSYLAALRNDFTTQYGGNSRYTVEDDVFLGSQIGKTAAVLFKLDDEYGINGL